MRMADYVAVERFCTGCNVRVSLKIPSRQWHSWKDGTHIQIAMPQLSDEEREILISGVCGTCFDEMFPEDE